LPENSFTIIRKRGEINKQVYLGMSRSQILVPTGP